MCGPSRLCHSFQVEITSLQSSPLTEKMNLLYRWKIDFAREDTYFIFRGNSDFNMFYENVQKFPNESNSVDRDKIAIRSTLIRVDIDYMPFCLHLSDAILYGRTTPFKF